MAEVEIPPALRRFILQAVPSVPHLEALLLLLHAHEACSAAEIAARLYVDPAVASQLLHDLERTGLVTLHGPRALLAASIEIRNRIAELAAFYAKHVVAISNLIHSVTDRKAHQFADAFRLRKDS
ncbi:MAG TPA: helix-turn-helix domain-containing protein [Lysobacter sp.]|nr:helix-turn-helix domain-containing protein [Lysobacter sp.]